MYIIYIMDTGKFNHITRILQKVIKKKYLI